MREFDGGSLALDEALKLPAAQAALGRVASAEITVVAEPDSIVLQNLQPLLVHLTRTGVRRRRVELIVATDGPETAEKLAGCVRLIENGGKRPVDWPREYVPEWLYGDVRVHVHDPRTASWFRLLADGTPVFLDDALREAEALVLVGMSHEGAPDLDRLLVPGLASPETRAAYLESGNSDLPARVARTLGVDLTVTVADRWFARICDSQGELSVARQS